MHYSKLTARKQNILEQFQRLNITDYEFIEKYDKSELLEKDLYRFYNVSLSAISLTLKHFLAYREIAEKYDHALILEDDVILSDRFVETLNIYISELPNQYDMLFIGDGCNLHIEKNKLINGKHIYKKCLHPTQWGGNGASRCTDSYIVSNKCALKLCNYLDSNSYMITFPCDWWLNVAARDNNLDVYWAEPTIVTQGSQNGIFKSSLN